MIHATSLRLGNLILEAGEIQRVYQLSIGGKTYDSINDMRVNRETGLIDNGEDIFQPIPLTAEWLINFGFDEGKWLEWKGQQINIFPGEFHLYGQDSATTGQAFCGNIKYVHQLMNLFHALTGEELTIKEKV